MLSFMLSMASITRRRGSKVWTAFFRDERGRQHCISTGTTDKRIAQVAAQEFEKAGKQKRTFRQIQKALDHLQEMITGEPIARLSLREYSASWLKGKKDETAASTLDFYSKSMSKMLEFFEVKSDAPITDLRREDLIGYRAHLAETLAPKTATHHLKCCKMLLKAAQRDRLIPENPAEFVTGVKRESGGSTKRPFTREELGKVLAVCDQEWRSMVLFALYTGQRLSDIATLRWFDIDQRRGEIRLTTSKTGRVMVLPIAPPLRKHIESLEMAEGAIHPRAFGIVKGNNRAAFLSNQFSDILARAGLRAYQPHHVSQGKGRGGRRTANALTFHSLRHTCTSWLHEAGVPQSVAMSFVGHDSAASNQIYVTVGDKALREAADLLRDVA
jgi:integrase